jgi:DNA-directed RNA polymerase subunit M/transcription elongation factor TFIIS
MKVIVCEQCGYEFARVEEKHDGQSLVVHPPEMKIIIVSKEPMKAEVECPKCQHRTEVDMELLRRFQT